VFLLTEFGIGFREWGKGKGVALLKLSVHHVKVKTPHSRREGKFRRRKKVLEE